MLIYASLAGLAFLVLAYIISSAPPIFGCPKFFCLPVWWKKHVEFPYSGVSFLALFLGMTLWLPLNLLCNYVWPFNRRWSSEKEAERILVNEGGPFEQLLDKALRRSKTVMVTLKGGKVYVGFVVSLIEPGSSKKNIQLLPTISGYREKERHRVNFTTFYAKVYEEIEKDLDDKIEQIEHIRTQLDNLKSDSDSKQTADGLKELLQQKETELEMLVDSAEDFGIVIPVDEITSISIYAAPIHERYFPHGADAPRVLPS